MADAIVASKICTKCQQEKPFPQYNKHKLGRFGLNPRCKACVKIDSRAYNDEHRDERNANSLAWYHANKGHVSVRASAWQKENKDRVNAKSKRWREKNLHKIVSYNRVYKSENKAVVAVQARQWRLENMEASRCITRNRKARIRNAIGKHTASETAHLLAKQHFRCGNCECDLTVFRKHLDHWHPLALGGSNSIENLQWLCQRCNQTKNDLDPVEWLRRIGKASHWPKQN